MIAFIQTYNYDNNLIIISYTNLQQVMQCTIVRYTVCRHVPHISTMNRLTLVHVYIGVLSVVFV